VRKKVSAMIRLLPLVLLLGGCMALQPFPQAARSGDTVTLAVGSFDGMTRVNTQAFFVSDADPLTQVDLTTGIRAVFNLYADRASPSYSTQTAFTGENFKYLHHETWETVIALDLPLGLLTGPGTITFQTTLPTPVALEPTALGNYPDLNTISIPMEILPGTGTASTFDYATTSGGVLSGSLRALRPQRQALVRPPVADTGLVWGSTYGAVEFTIALSMVDNLGGVVDENSIRLVTQDVTTFTKSKAQMTWSYDGAQLKVLFLSAPGKLQYYEPRFSIVAETAEFTSTPVINSVRYYDINGVETTIAPAITDYSVALLGVVIP